MRSVDVSIVTRNIKEMCIQANHFLSEDMDIAMKNAVETEEAPLGKQILTQLQENLKIAGEDMIPICQDTGMAVVFIEVGQEVHFEGGSLTDAINEGVRQGYVEGYLRKSVVGDPIIRENTKEKKGNWEKIFREDNSFLEGSSGIILVLVSLLKNETNFQKLLLL